MNELARILYDLVTEKKMSVAGSCLSPLEQGALADLASLLRRPAQDQADFLAQGPQPVDWLSRPPKVCGSIQS